METEKIIVELIVFFGMIGGFIYFIEITESIIKFIYKYISSKINLSKFKRKSEKQIGVDETIFIKHYKLIELEHLCNTCNEVKKHTYQTLTGRICIDCCIKISNKENLVKSEKEFNSCIDEFLKPKKGYGTFTCKCGKETIKNCSTHSLCENCRKEEDKKGDTKPLTTKKKTWNKIKPDTISRSQEIRRKKVNK